MNDSLMFSSRSCLRLAFRNPPMPPSKYQQLSCKLRSSKTSQPRKRKILFKNNKQKRTRKFKEVKTIDEKSDQDLNKTDDALIADEDAPQSMQEVEKGTFPSEILKTENDRTNIFENDPLEEAPLMIDVPEDATYDAEIKQAIEEKGPTVDAEKELTVNENSNTVIDDENHSTVNIVDNKSEDSNESINSMSPEKSAELKDLSTKNTCAVCNIVTDSTASLTQHMKQHCITNNQTHQCLICSKLLSSASSLDRHMLVHSGERPFKCKLCDMSFTTNGNMHRHMRTHGEFELTDVTTSPDLTKSINLEKESKSSDEKIFCPVCGKNFLCKYGLLSHMETHPNDPIICQKCNMISINYSAHVEHKCNTQLSDSPTSNNNSLSQGFHDLTFMDFTSNKFSLVSKSYCEKIIKRPSSAFHIFQCSECNKSFPCSRALKLHQKIHKSDTGMFCPSCQCDFAASAFFKTHQLKHRAPEHCQHNTFQNESEEILYAGKEDFLALLNLQTKESHLSLMKNIHACNVKEDEFENVDYFVHGKIIKPPHQSEHDTVNNNSSNNDFADIQSIISLTSKAPLITPAQTSPIAARPASPLPYMTTEMPQSPEVAESANSNPETPSKELISMCNRIAMPDPQTSILYSCNVCSQQFRNVGTLNRHCKLHVQRGSNYSCHLCSYVSVDKSTLIRHLRTHNGERPFQCVICKYAFTTKANCERHVRKRHKKVGKAEIRNAMQYNPNMSLRGTEQSTEIGNTETICKYCGVDFKFNRVLRHHLRSLHNSCNRKPFSCKICKFGFSTKNNCIRHVLKQHPNLKDKLRSVVVSNAAMMHLSQGRNSPSDDSSSSCVNQPICEEIEPLDLQSKTSDSPLDLKSDKNAHANEAVIAAEGLVSLSEAQPLQDEPLDLAAHPLDLSCKPLAAVTKKVDLPQNQVFSSSPISLSTREPVSVGSIDLTFTRPMSECQKPEKTASQNLSKIQNINRNEMPFASSQKLRSFTCIYCKAGFTLKSNMERHIKRKHPEYARPTRSRNYIPSIVTPSLQKQNPSTLSDKTRDALRHVLNSKVQQIPVLKTFNSNTLSKLGTFKILGASNFIAKPNRNNLGSTVNLSLDLSGKTKTVTIVDINAKSVPQTKTEENCSDLASVSSVICTANSPQFKQYLEKSSEIVKNTNSETEMQKSSDESSSTKKSEMPSVSCPFCDRKFPWSSSLRRHILTHTGQKPFKCPKCALWFTTKSNCERHLIRKHGHKGDLITRSVPDRPYKCNHCLTSTFSTQGNLRKHFYLKHWTKSYLGMNCKPNQIEAEDNKSEENKSKLSISQVTSQEHSYSQQGKCRFSCNFCNSSFADFIELRKHMSNHKDLAFMCYMCKTSFLSHEACLCHFKMLHSSIYKEINEENLNFDIKEIPATPETTGNQNSLISCMLCFQQMSSVEDLQQHFETHLTKTQSAQKETILSKNTESLNQDKGINEFDSTKQDNSKKLKVTKTKVKNSLLYLFTPNSTSNTSVKTVKAKLDLTTPEENSDLIQNLLGIHDSKMIDEMLVSADSAARLLGVKEV